MSIPYSTRSCALALMAVILAGCAQTGPGSGGKERTARAHPRAEDVRTQRANRPAPPAPKRDDVALREGIALFNDGDYNGAIRRLSSGDMNGAAPRERLSAYKYIAFSYCVTGRQALCRQHFDRALKLDPNFDLGPGEHGHPQWGPVFAQAKAAAKR